MISELKKRIMEHFVPQYIYFAENGPIVFEEKSDGGEGMATFHSNSPCIMIKASNQAPLLWAFSNKKCAEGALLTINNGEFHLHIIELKSKLSRAEWSKAMSQLSGMYLAALATCRVLGINNLNSVVCYIGYKKNAMTVDRSADPVLLKTFVGKSNPVGRNDEWENEKMLLPFNVEAIIRKGQRDSNQNVDFGSV